MFDLDNLLKILEPAKKIEVEIQPRDFVSSALQQVNGEPEETETKVEIPTIHVDTIIVSTISVIFFIKGKNYVFKKEHPAFEYVSHIALRAYDDKLLKESEFEFLQKNLSLSDILANWSEGRIVVKDGGIYFDHKLLPSGLELLVIRLASSLNKRGFNAWQNFFIKSGSAVNYARSQFLYDFVSQNEVIISEDGDVYLWIALPSSYKYVQRGQRLSGSSFMFSSWNTVLERLPNGSTEQYVFIVEMDPRDLKPGFNKTFLTADSAYVYKNLGVFGKDVFASSDPLELLLR